MTLSPSEQEIVVKECGRELLRDRIGHFFGNF